MHIGPYRFKPRLFMTVGYLVIVACMIALAFWQLRRADEKIALLSAAESAQAAPAVDLDVLAVAGEEGLAAAAKAYRRVRLIGCYDDVRQFLWDNRSHSGSPGFEAITPLKLQSGRLALVNRGWLPLGSSREDLPDLTLERSITRRQDDPSTQGSNTRQNVSSPTKPGACVTVVGLFTRPSKGLMSGPAMAPPTNWPRIIQYFDYDAVAGALGEPIVAGIVQLQQVSSPSARPEALIANWQPAASGPEKHYGYAFQWFAMATALTVLYVMLNTVKSGRPESADNDALPHD